MSLGNIGQDPVNLASTANAGGFTVFEGSTAIWHSARIARRRLDAGRSVKLTAVWNGRADRAGVTIARGLTRSWPMRAAIRVRRRFGSSTNDRTHDPGREFLAPPRRLHGRPGRSPGAAGRSPLIPRRGSDRMWQEIHARRGRVERRSHARGDGPGGSTG